MVAVGFDAARYCCGLYGSRALVAIVDPGDCLRRKTEFRHDRQRRRGQVLVGLLGKRAEFVERPECESPGYRRRAGRWAPASNPGRACRVRSPGASTLDIDAGPLESPMRQIGLVLRAVSLTVALLR